MIYNPIYEFEKFRNILDRLAYGGGKRSMSGDNFSAPNIYTSEDGYLIQEYIPGVKPEDVNVNYENAVMTITLKRTAVDESYKDYKKSRLERSDYDFTRRFSVPQDADVEKIDAKIANGMLTISVPRGEETKPKKISVKVK